MRQIGIGKIVTYKHDEKVWISRVVAREGDSIQISEGGVNVNGSRLDEPGVRRNWDSWKYGAYAIDKMLQIPQGYIFVLSDNLSAHHDDSRVFGPVSKESILGVVW